MATGVYSMQCIFRGEGSGEREEFLPLLAEWKLERYALKFNSFDIGGGRLRREIKPFALLTQN